MAYDMKNGRKKLGEIANTLQAEHPCNARQMGFLLIAGMQQAHQEIERLKQEIQDVTVAALGVVLDSASAPGVVQHSGKDKWYAHEVPILYDPVLGIPHGVRFLKDNDGDTWIRVGTQNRWRDQDWDDETLREDGYITVEEILSEHAEWVQAIPDAERHVPIVFGENDYQPDVQSFPVFRTLNLDMELWFHWSYEDDKFHCMNNDGKSQDFCRDEFGTLAPDWKMLVRKTRLEEVPQ